MDDPVRGEEPKGSEETKAGIAETDRRTLLRTAGLAGAAGAALAGAMHGKFSLAPVTAAQAQTAAMPKGTDKPWWPSKWGKDDEAGASNHITPAKVLDAAKWIKDGKIYKIGRVYEQGMPLFGARASRYAFPVVRPAARSATTSLCIMTIFSLPKSARPARSSMALATSASRWARTATRTRCGSTTASPPRDQRRLRSQEARRRETQAPLHPCASDRHGRAQGRDDGRRSGDHLSRYQGGAGKTEHPRERHQARRRDHVPYRLGLAMDEEQ